MSDEFDRDTLPEGATLMSDLPPSPPVGPEYGVTLTVGRLKELLKDVPDDYGVDTEGCDCIGRAKGIEIDPDKTVLVTRL